MIGSEIRPRCVFLNLNLSDNALLTMPEDELRKILQQRWPSLVDGQDSNEKGFCRFCLGMLQDSFLQSCVEFISRRVEDEKYKCANFKMLISQPVQLLLFGRHVHNNHYGDFDAHRKSGNGLEIKDVMKLYLEPLLEKSLSLAALTKGNAELEISIVIRHGESEKTLLPKLEMHIPECFVKAKRLNEHLEKKRSREDLTIFNISTINHALKCLTSEKLSDILTGNYHLHPVALSKISTMRIPIFLAGRYCKYSRDLSQTPWILDGKRMSEMSVEEYIAIPVKKLLRADRYNFSSSGREDVDVRTLRNGRQFLLEVFNAREFSSIINITDLQTSIKQGTDLVKVQDLQLVEKVDVKNLKDGEEAKTKSYMAVCYAKLDQRNLEDSKLKLLRKFIELSDSKDVKIEQRTPLRVLHRRNLATRTRLIYSLKMEIISKAVVSEIISMPSLITDEYVFFKLTMTTQAGTYVKEFVHGDFGRTVPNARSLLGIHVDILSLDVTAVNVDWPPTV